MHGLLDCGVVIPQKRGLQLPLYADNYHILLLFTIVAIEPHPSHMMFTHMTG